MISIREIADDKTTISSTRWAFAVVVYFDITVIALTLIAGLVGHFVPGLKEIEGSFYGSVAALLGVLTTIIGTTKALQGFETHSKRDREFPKRDERFERAERAEKIERLEKVEMDR